MDKVSGVCQEDRGLIIRAARLVGVEAGGDSRGRGLKGRIDTPNEWLVDAFHGASVMHIKAADGVDEQLTFL